MKNHEPKQLSHRGIRLFPKALVTCAFSLAAHISSFSAAYCNMATLGSGEKLTPSPISEPLRGRIEAGLSQNLSYMKAHNQNLYPLWPRGSVNQFVIFDDKKLFYNGLLYANLSMLGDVTGVKFELGPKPQLVAILSEKLKSWQDVNAFLATQNTSYRIPLSMTTTHFTGCNKIQYSDNGTIRLAVLIIDISENRDFGQIDRCIFSELIGAFGFDTSLQSKNTITELASLQIMYGLNASERDSSKIIDEILRRMPVER